VALTIAGSDSSGGAGIQADLKTFTALGVYGASAITALTAQNTTGVQAVHPVPAPFVTAQIASVLADLDVKAVKTGMLADAGIIAAVAEALAARPDMPLVVDPVMVATSGDPLLRPDAVETLKSALIPRATLITPNLPEASALTGLPPPATEEEVEAMLDALARLGAGAVLLKGGHGGSPEAVDYLRIGHGPTRRLSGPRLVTDNTHGTGCTLSAAITAFLAGGDDLETAAARAKRWLGQAIASATTHRLGKGHGPVDHLFSIRRTPTPL
jgi:hydroxymethylpyrimidine/phosphomethylpyrimidine kinase